MAWGTAAPGGPHLAIASDRGGRRPHRGVERAVRRFPQPAARLHAEALRHRDDLRANPATWTPGARRSDRRRSCCCGERPRQSRSGRAGHPVDRADRAGEAHRPLVGPRTFAYAVSADSRSRWGRDLVYHSAGQVPVRARCNVAERTAGRRRALDCDRAHAASGERRRFAELCEPYDGFHGMVFSEESTVGAFRCARVARACATSAPA